MITTLLTYAATTAAAGVATAVVAELIARSTLKSQDAWFVRQPHSRQAFHIATDVLPGLEATARFEANADGERGDPVPERPEDVLRVLIAGGSAAECFLLDQPSSWPMVAQRVLKEAGTPAHVGSVARSLIPCRTIDLLLAKALPRFKSLDAIVLMVGASDMVAWFEAKTPASLEESEVDIARYCEEHPQGPFTWSPKGTALYRIVRRLMTRLRRPVNERQGAGKSIAKHRQMRADAKVMLDEVPDAAPMLDGFETHLRSLVATCKRFAPRVIVARQPWLDRDFTPDEAARLWNFGQGSPYRGALDTYYTHRVVRELMGAVDDVAVRVADTTGVEAFDLRTVVPSDFDHYYDFLHFTPKGAELVGRRLAAQLEDENGATKKADPPANGESAA